MPANLKAISVRQLMRQKPPGWFEELLIRLGARAAAPIVTGTASYVGGRLAERRRTRKKLGFAMDEQIEMYPMKSQAQRRFLHAVHPDIAEEFESKTPAGKKLPEHARKKKKYALSPKSNITIRHAVDEAIRAAPQRIIPAGVLASANLAAALLANRRKEQELQGKKPEMTTGGKVWRGAVTGLTGTWPGYLIGRKIGGMENATPTKHAKKKKKYELPLGSRLKWGAKRWAKRAALVGGGALGGAAYVKTRRAKREYDVLRSAGFTPQEASEIATAGILGKYSLNYQAPSATPIRTGLGQVWSGLKSGYETAAPHVQEWLKRPTSRRLALAGAGAGYYLGRRKKREREGYSLSYAKKEKTYPIRRAILGVADMHTKDLVRTLQSHGGPTGFFGKAAAHELKKRGFSDQEIQKAMKKVYSLQGYSLYQQYKNNPDLMRAIAARDGVELDVQRYAIQDVLTGWQLGYKHGEEEAQGIRPAPGALRLAALMTLHGESYVLGRQKALTEAGMHGGTRQSESFLETLVKSVDRLLGGETKSAEALETTASA